MARPVSFVLNLDPASDPISGSLVYPDGRKVGFAGWIELTAALEEARHFEPLDVVAHGNETSPEAGSERAGSEQEDPAGDERR